MIRTSRLAAVAFALAATAAPALADPYSGPVAGSTTGCFYLDSNPASCSAAPTASLGGLQFTGATDANLGMIVNGGGTITLGTLRLTPHPGNSSGLFNNRSFSLFAAFTQPGGEETFVAALDGFAFTPYFFGGQLGIGLVNQQDSGPRTVSYSGLSGYGSFVIDIDDEELLTVNIDNMATIRATISNATFTAAPTVTPEPATVALLATGLAGIGGFGAVRRRRAAA